MKNLAESIKNFHTTMKGLEKDASNPFFNSQYVSLDNVLSSIKIPMQVAGLAFVQMPSHIDGKPALLTKLIDIESGESIEATTPLLMSKLDAQGQGSAITYMRRYALVSMLGLSTDTDDDGNSAVRGSQGSTSDVPDMELGDTEAFNRAMDQDPI